MKRPTIKTQNGINTFNAYLEEVRVYMNFLEKENAQLKANQNKIKADAVREAKESGVFSHDQGGGIFDSGFTEALYQYDNHLDKHANKLEQGE